MFTSLDFAAAAVAALMILGPMAAGASQAGSYNNTQAPAAAAPPTEADGSNDARMPRDGN